VTDGSSVSEAKEKFVTGVDESDRYTDSGCVACGDDGAEEIVDPGEGWGKRSLSREVDAEVRKPERLIPSFGCEWERRKFDGK